MAKLLVTGAAGFIGSHTVDRLLSEGHRVVGVDTLRSGRLDNLVLARQSPHFQLIAADVCDETRMRRLFRAHRFDGVAHLAALVSVPESFRAPALNARLNLMAVDRLARLCIDYECPRIVFASSAAVYGNEALLPNQESAEPRPLSPYAAAKLAAEVMLLGYAESYGLETVCFRYFNVYGPRQDPGSPYSGVLSIFTQRFQAGQAVTIYGDGEQTRDFVAVEDVARANGHALTAQRIACGRYNLCTGRAVSLNQVLAIYGEIYPDAPPARRAEPRIGDIRHSLGDPARLRTVMGIAAETPFEQGLRALIARRDPYPFSKTA